MRCPLRLVLPRSTSIKKLENVNIPSAPIWINERIIIWPVSVKRVPVSTTVNPVTQTADVAVKRASMNLSLPVADIDGRVSNVAPIKIVVANPATRIVDGERGVRPRGVSFSVNNLIFSVPIISCTY